MEKSLNKGDLQGFKTSEMRQNAMVPGLLSASPLRNAQYRQAANLLKHSHGASLGDLKQEL